MKTTLKFLLLSLWVPTFLLGQNLSEEPAEARCGFIFDRHPTLYCRDNYHYLVSLSSLGDLIDFEDGSGWRVNPYDSYKVFNWFSDDPLVVTQNSRWFSSYAYKVINKRTGSSVEADLFRGPFANGEFTLYIYAIDPVLGEVMLTDSSRWQISSHDLDIFDTWDLDDAIILGSNSGWDSDCEAILINVNTNNFARAGQF